MARNERASNCWSQPRRSTPAKIRPGCSRGLRADDLDDLGDIVNAFACGERGRHGRDSWQSSREISNSGCFSSSSCCLKNGRVQCSCSWSKNTYPEQQRKGVPKYPQPFNRAALPFENKSSLWPDNNISNGCFQDNRMLEEFILDDNELCLLNYYDIPINVPRRRHLRNVGKVKTVSIIDTLSELASGATDREDEGGFSSAVSESAVLNRCLYKPRAKHPRQLIPKKDRTFRDTCVTRSVAPKILEANATHKPLVNNALNTQSDNFNCQNFADEGHLTCSSLKRTLKYLRKAVSTNVVEEEIHNRKHIREIKDEDDAFRLCFSDSEVKDGPVQWTSLKKEKLDYSSHTKSKSLLTVNDPFVEPVVKPSSLFRGRTKAAAPDWIQDVFYAAKKGDNEKMKIILKDIDPALVRNLSDDHGNNLWHICAVHNNFECLNWLCSHNQHHVEALKDENKNGFSPVSLAVKHGSLLAVQWLIHNTVSKAQLMPQTDSRSLLHVAARYGQDAIVEWLLGYMTSHELDATIVDAEGNTALHLASKYGHIACIKALVFQIGSLKTKNEHGLKPLDLAVKHNKTDCADYLVALESCYNLAALNLRQQSEIQQLQKENTEIKNFFKELLTLTRRLQNRQKELVQSFSRINPVARYDRSNEKNIRQADDYSQLLSTVMTDEEHHLLMVEDRWKKLRKQAKYPDSKKKPLDVLRSQMSHVREKASCQSPPIPSTPDTSDESWQSEDEDNVPKDSIPEFSAPDVVNSLSPQSSVPFLNSKRKTQKATNSNRVFKDLDIKPESVPTLSLQNTGSLSKNVLNNRDVNLRMFFKQNPNLRQSGETCSVLEVLEPSSSDSEECSAHKKKSSKMYNSEKEAEQSSSSSAQETLSPYSCRPSSSGSKASGSRSSSNGSRQNPFSPNSNNSFNTNCHSSSDKSKQPENEQENSQSEIGDKGTSDQLCSNISSEPDLIKGTQKKKIIPLTEKVKKSKDFPPDNLNDNPSISTEDSESLEADRSFSSTNDIPETAVLPNSDSAVSGSIKKKSFLLKFALRGRWPSKTSPRSLKNEISPEEFRETYSRTALMDSVLSPSQIIAGSDNSSKKNSPPTKIESEKFSLELQNQEKSASNERLSDCGSFSMTPLGDGVNLTFQQSRRGLLPPRRDPPPAPPINVREDEQSQDHSDDDMSVSIQKSSISSCAEDCLTSSVSLQHSYLESRSSDLWHSPDSKSLFRPASSASRVGSLSRGEEHFSLNKSSSASTEMLSALDSSTAGRQSPAPSEVSKTESALSPPSDVSKTESIRYLSQLGRIEESGHLTTIAISNLQQKEEQSIKEATLTNDGKLEIKHKKKSKKINSDKPWYEFSDEDDVIVPHRYQTVSVGMRSSSEDEGAITG